MTSASLSKNYLFPIDWLINRAREGRAGEWWAARGPGAEDLGSERGFFISAFWSPLVHPIPSLPGTGAGVRARPCLGPEQCRDGAGGRCCVAKGVSDLNDARPPASGLWPGVGLRACSSPRAGEGDSLAPGSILGSARLCEALPVTAGVQAASISEWDPSLPRMPALAGGPCA